MTKKKLKINISFPLYDEYIYDYIKSQKNPSAFIRKLVEAHMNGTLVNVHNLTDALKPTQEPIKIETERKVEVVETGQFNPTYDNIRDLEQINELPF